MLLQNKQEKILLTDVDGVLLEFEEQLLHFIETEKGIPITRDNPDAYWIHEILGIPREEGQGMVMDFFASDYFSRIPAKDCARDVLTRFHDEGWKIIAITACLHDDPRVNIPQMRKKRLDNIEHFFGDILHELHMIDLSDNKGDVLKNYESTWWVDDLTHHANAGHEVGHRAIIMERNFYNPLENKYNLPTAKDWHTIEEMIKKQEK